MPKQKITPSWSVELRVHLYQSSRESIVKNSINTNQLGQITKSQHPKQRLFQLKLTFLDTSNNWIKHKDILLRINDDIYAWPNFIASGAPLLGIVDIVLRINSNNIHTEMCSENVWRTTSGGMCLALNQHKNVSS